ncbi:LacI family transcriptional regulator [Halolactibacillus alkaliphilus]|uniref:LacI family transcriptional regulator n=1 Tax=Halolactibacillus alkaliphilus TaxID=442899 RepID=A0A511X1K3_9BACI|nr:LacI family DNA-binding transcriptional regulator [Halolactibacillus alkaliphilus]GEN56829.1 LacI family transcriptional regulator [Halolactibacillus alkaliphilus]GGN70992.1 LacI family transcriptional regulator [Halolactibacillus alkaliphilus]SFO80674.1 transcriptional regulator, LacI family [Halolactibacillus alkaliphilus]
MRIKDIAKLAGVSPATVSRVMNNNGYVKDEKREAVLKVIKEVDYQPNSIAKSLKNQKSHMLGVIVPKISTETASRVVSGVTEVAKAHGYQVLIANTDLDIEEEINYLKFLSNKSVDGIVMMGTEITDRHLEVMDKLTVPIVILGQEVFGYTSIIHNDYEASYQMTAYLISQGHKAIAFIGVSEKDKAVGVIRKNGYLDCIKDHGLEVDEELMAIGDFDIDTGYQMMNKVLEKKIPTAVYAVTDHLAIGATHALLDKGYRVPEDVSVVGIGDIKLAEYLNPPLTTVHYTFKTSGKMAAEVVFDLIHRVRTKGECLMTTFELKKRASVKNIR